MTHRRYRGEVQGEGRPSGFMAREQVILDQAALHEPAGNESRTANRGWGSSAIPQGCQSVAGGRRPPGRAREHPRPRRGRRRPNPTQAEARPLAPRRGAHPWPRNRRCRPVPTGLHRRLRSGNPAGLLGNPTATAAGLATLRGEGCSSRFMAGEQVTCGKGALHEPFPSPGLRPPSPRVAGRGMGRGVPTQVHVP